MPVEATVSDKEWQARWDAQTLSEAEVIKADQGRLGAAQNAAGKLADDKDEEKKAMDKVAHGGSGAPPAKGGQAPAKEKIGPENGGTVPNQPAFNVFQKLPRPKGL